MRVTKIYLRMEKKIKKNDIILIVVILAVAIAAYLGLFLFQAVHTQNAEAVVTIDGAEYGRFPLNQDLTEKIEQAGGSYNLLVIRDGEADVTEASCPDGICVNHKNVSRQGETIVCLPNKVVVEIQNGKEAEVDEIAN